MKESILSLFEGSVVLITVMFFPVAVAAIAYIIYKIDEKLK